LKPLSAEQIVSRVLHEAQQATFRRAPGVLRWRLRAPPGLATIGIRHAPAARSPETLQTTRQSHAKGTVWIAGREVKPTDWDDSSLPKLVRYHLHYLDIARSWTELSEADGAPKLLEDALQLIQRWKQAHPTGVSEGWEPYPVSARLINLCVVAATLGPTAPVWLRAMIEVHARYVAAFPERHLQANHLLKNWTALSCAGLLLQSEEATAWAKQGLEETRVQLGEQILSDGGHYERSPMYHSLVMWDLLDLRNFALAASKPLPWLSPVLDRMGTFLASVLHPDGEIPLFNDAVLGQAPAPAEIFGRLGTVPTTPHRLFDAPDTGLIALRPGRDEAVLFDAGPLGPPHQPGHAHSDTLSFEASIGGERRIVNAGTDGYQSPYRAFYRSAVAHNTVTVNGEGPDELWSGFRVGGRSQITARRMFDQIGFLAVRASLRAFQGWEQERTLLLFPHKALVVLDEVRAPAAATVVSRLREVRGTTPLRFVALAGEAQQRSTAYAPEFGRTFEATEHAVQAYGRRVHLAYALLWGASEVKLHLGFERKEVELEGQRYRLP
jgi:uncharacterized heparinase superfamily protein